MPSATSAPAVVGDAWRGDNHFLAIVGITENERAEDNRRESEAIEGAGRTVRPTEVVGDSRRGSHWESVRVEGVSP